METRSKTVKADAAAERGGGPPAGSGGRTRRKAAAEATSGVEKGVGPREANKKRGKPEVNVGLAAAAGSRPPKRSKPPARGGKPVRPQSAADAALPEGVAAEAAVTLKEETAPPPLPSLSIKAELEAAPSDWVEDSTLTTAGVSGGGGSLRRQQAQADAVTPAAATASGGLGGGEVTSALQLMPPLPAAAVGSAGITAAEGDVDAAEASSTAADARLDESELEPDITITVNRAPVLTLWVAVCSQRQGFSFEEGLTFGKYIAGHFAQSKGRNIGVYEARDETPERRAGRMERLRAEAERVDVFGTHVYARSVPPGGKLLAVASSDTPERTIDPASVDSYLRRAFGDKLEVAKRAMQRLAGAVPPSQLDHHALAYKLYEQFRPQVPAGPAGWGHKGALSTRKLHQMESVLLHLHTVVPEAGITATAPPSRGAVGHHQGGRLSSSSPGSSNGLRSQPAAASGGRSRI